MGYFNLSKQLIRLRGQICVVLKGTVSRDFWPFLGKKKSIWTPYEQAKTIYLEVVFVFRKIFMKTYVHWLLTLLTWFLHSYWRCFHGVSWHCPFNPLKNLKIFKSKKKFCFDWQVKRHLHTYYICPFIPAVPWADWNKIVILPQLTCPSYVTQETASDMSSLGFIA